MLPCKQDCQLNELRQFYITNIEQIFSIIPFFPYPSRCMQTILDFISNGTYINVEVKASIIKSIFSQVDPIFFQIYGMTGGMGAFNDSNVTLQIDPNRYLNAINKSMESQTIYMDMNSTITNMTVIFF
jgi:hypothetical protein